MPENSTNYLAYRFLTRICDPSERIVIGILHEDPNVTNEWGKRTVFHIEVPVSDLNEPENKWVLQSGKQTFYPLTLNKKHGKSLFFIINGGGTKNSEINKIRVQFIDVDLAKEKFHFENEKDAREKETELKKNRSIFCCKGRKIKINRRMGCYDCINTKRSEKEKRCISFTT
ncbi:hypothetical protein QBX67_26975 [Bacillus sp. LS15-K4]|nr:hypothetical protein [Bacillus sp. LS15-K4]MDJ1478674.1 hypothetical protein [Bacillus sp. LS15-K4]